MIKKAFLPDIADFFFELLDKLTVMAPFPLANNRTSVLSWAFEFVVLPPYWNKNTKKRKKDTSIGVELGEAECKNTPFTWKGVDIMRSGITKPLLSNNWFRMILLLLKYYNWNIAKENLTNKWRWHWATQNKYAIRTNTSLAVGINFVLSSFTRKRTFNLKLKFKMW